MNIINVFEIMTNSDKVEGRGVSMGTGICFPTKDEAIKFVCSDHFKKFSVMGMLPEPSLAEYDIKEKIIELYETFEEFEENQPEVVKQKLIQTALSKLNDEEKEVLGLNRT